MSSSGGAEAGGGGLGDDLASLGIGALAWASVIPLVSFAGEAIKRQNSSVGPKLLFLGVGAALALVTTPLLARILGWRTRHARVRGIALSLGTAQTLDGIVHMFFPQFYSNDPIAAHYASACVFFGAGTLGIASAFA